MNSFKCYLCDKVYERKIKLSNCKGHWKGQSKLRSIEENISHYLRFEQSGGNKLKVNKFFNCLGIPPLKARPNKQIGSRLLQKDQNFRIENDNFKNQV